MDALKPLLESKKETFLNELKELLSIPSVSADPKYKDDVHRTAKYVKDKLEAAGAKNVRLMDTPGYPIVFGEYIQDSQLPTILVYGHYDVQPPEPLELWNSPAFEPVVKDEKVYARGASDDKGQMYMHIKAFQLMMEKASLPCNVKFLIEGEEEVGSEHLEGFVEANSDLLSADVVLISDTAIIANDVPSITTGLRGMAYVQVEVTGPNRDLHSGIYGGGVANPINVLSKMIASLHDENRRVNIPGFYDDVIELSREERDRMAEAPFDLSAYKDHLDIDDVEGEADYTTWERVSIRPTLDVNGIWGGYIGEGAKTVLPSKAYAKISMRLVPGQDHQKVSQLFENHFKKIAPKTVKVKVTHMHGGEPAVTPTDSIAYKAASMAMETTFGKKPIPQRTGGSIPIVTMFERVLGIKTVLMGFGLDSDSIHSPNEHFGLFNFYKGIETIPYFFQYFTELKQQAS